MEIVRAVNQKKAIERAVAVLKDGGLIIYPTETCYGLGADATNSGAVKKLLEFKGSRGGKAVSVAVADGKMARKYVEINETARNFYRKFLPGPLTVISRSRGKTAPALEAGTGTLGIRIPDYPLALEIIKRFDRPITSTSANTSGKKAPYCLKDVLKYTTKKRLALIDLFLDAGRLPYNPPSTVVDTTLNEPQTLRQGEIKIRESSENTLISGSEEETKKTARQIFSKYEKALRSRCLVFALQGELGSGKTQFAKGLAKALGIRNNVSSPTFTIIHEHPFKRNVFYHLDTWRLERGEELLDLGLEKMLRPGNIIAIEWLQKVRPILARLSQNKKIQLVWINIKHLSETKRKISYSE